MGSLFLDGGYPRAAVFLEMVCVLSFAKQQCADLEGLEERESRLWHYGSPMFEGRGQAVIKSVIVM